MQLERVWTWRYWAKSLCLAAGLFLAGLGLATAEDAGDVVKVSAAASNVDAAGKQVITVTVELDKGWHIYANPINDPDCIPYQTKVIVSAKAAPAAIQVQYPEGKMDRHNLLVYKGRVTIPVNVQRAQGDTGPLEVSVRYNACNNDQKKCLAPNTIKITVP